MMAEFAETMRQWRRMCKKYSTDDDTCCDGCPVVEYREHGCGAIFELDGRINFKKYEIAIMEWAKKNPEPVYPTWREVIEEITGIMMIDVVDDPIPADVAQKLEIDPKEGI